MLIKTFYIYKDVPNTDGRYVAYLNGEIYDKLKNIYLEQKVNVYGYCSPNIRYSNGKGTQLWHRVIAQTFISNPENKPQINHKDANKENNCVDNLEWATSQENMTHLSENGLHEKSYKTCLIENEEIIDIYASPSDAARKNNVNRGDVRYCCIGKIDSTKNRRFRFYNENDKSFVKTRFDYNKSTSKGAYNKKILCTTNGKIYNSQKDVVFELNVLQSNLSKVLNGKMKETMGYNFLYLIN